VSESKDYSSTPPSVEQQTRRGVSWSFAGAVITNGMRLVVVAVLGRALTSTDFGIVAAALSVNAIIYGIRDVGIGSALVQRTELEAGHISTAFALSTYLGFGLATVLFIAAPWIGIAYGITESTDLIRALALFFALRSVSSTSRMLAQRAMNFRRITIIDALSFSAGSTVSMVAAVAGAGPWSLVAGYLVEEVIAGTMYVWSHPPKFSLRIDTQRLRELMQFGIGQTIIQSANIVATYGDNFVVGNALGARELGYYTRAYDLIKFPSMVFDAIVGNVLFPAFSKLQHDREKLATGFRRVAFVNALVLLPASAAIIVLAPEAIRLLMGPGWEDAVLPFRVLAVTILLRTNLKLGGILAQAAGAVNAVAVAYVIYMLVVVGGASFAIRWGVVGVAVSTAIAITLVSIHCSYLALQVSKLTLASFLAANGPGLVLAAIVTAMAWPLSSAMRSADVHPSLIFAVVGGAAIALCLIAVAVWVRSRRGDFEWLGGELRRLRRTRGAR